MTEELISIARIARPQGIRGEVVADVLTDYPERFAERRQVWLGKTAAAARLIELEKARIHQHRVILKFKGCDTRNDAELLREQQVMIEREALVELPANEFFHFDLIGCAIVTREGETLGTVSDVQDFGAAPLLVTTINEREVMIPLADSICVEVDTAQKRILVELPEGLLDL
ncbi:MAG: 16S rRNA processing protein RimM [Acidobacteria bacterium]|nr:16S rRNA processing protein RimM [Acidobacteriota bacterium]